MSDDKKTTAPASKGRRFWKLAEMTASVATNYASQKIKGAFRDDEERTRAAAESHRQNGERIAKTLGELKGAAMKIGQMASIGNDFLPRELSDALKSLQKDSPPMPWEVIAAQIERELGSPPEMLFSRFSREPFAAASIGQVHRATTDDGREVVVKIQYPGIDASVDSDLAHLKVALRASGLIQIPREAMNRIFEEMRDRLHEELDYTNEAQNVRTFRNYHARHPFMVVPDVIGERSAQRVLTLTWEPGDHIDDLIPEEGYSTETVDQIAENLFRMLAGQIFELRAVHADPNPGNIAFRPDGSIVLYDYGCIKQVSPNVVEGYRHVLRAALSEDYDLLDEGMILLGVRVRGKPSPGAEFYKDWRDLFLEPFLDDRVFDFGNARMHEEVVRRAPKVLPILQSFQPPTDVIFIDRAIGGHYGNLKRMKARGNYLRLLMEHIDRLPEPDPTARG